MNVLTYKSHYFMILILTISTIKSNMVKSLYLVMILHQYFFII